MDRRLFCTHDTTPKSPPHAPIARTSRTRHTWPCSNPRQWRHAHRKRGNGVVHGRSSAFSQPGPRTHRDPPCPAPTRIFTRGTARPKWAQSTPQMETPPTPQPRPTYIPWDRQKRLARTSDHTYPQGTPQPRSAKCDRHLRQLRTRPRPQEMVSRSMTLNHGQTMPHFGDTTSVPWKGTRFL